MVYRRKKPPSQIRYERSHPTISARVDMETYKKLKKMAESEGKTLAGFLKDFVKGKKETWAKSYNKGYGTGKKEHQLWYRCNVCGEKIYMEPNSESHKAMIDYMKRHDWGHVECHEREE